MSDVHRDTSRFPSRPQALVIFVVGVVLIALAGAGFVLVFIVFSPDRVTAETYDYFLFVRIQTPESGAEVWVPVPDYPELQERVLVDESWVPFDEFPTRNVTQTVIQTTYGTMYRFVFSESFALHGDSTWRAPGAANGTLTFSSQVSNSVWIRLTNVSSGNQVSIILYYENDLAQADLCGRKFFVSTADPRVAVKQPDLIFSAGYVGQMVREEKSYTTLADGWGRYDLVTGGFLTCGTG